MEVKECNVEVGGRGDCILLRGFFDIHAGVRACDIERFKRDVEDVRTTPNMYAFLGGDMCDFISPDDKRFDAKTLTPETLMELNNLPLKMAREVIDILLPIKHKLLFGLEGNHEKTIHDKRNIDVAGFICSSLGVPCLGYTALIRLKIGKRNENIKSAKGGNHYRRTVMLYVSHGFGSALKFGGKMNRLIDCIQMIEADIYWMGHNHGKGVAMTDRLYGSSKGYEKIVAHHKVCILGGTYLKTYQRGQSGYGERKGYVPTPIGCMTLKIIPLKAVWDKNRKMAVDAPIEFSVESKTEMSDEIMEMAL
jgi:hypothetical protein